MKVQRNRATGIPIAKPPSNLKLTTVQMHSILYKGVPVETYTVPSIPIHARTPKEVRQGLRDTLAKLQGPAAKPPRAPKKTSTTAASAAPKKTSAAASAAPKKTSAAAAPKKTSAAAKKNDVSTMQNQLTIAAHLDSIRLENGLDKAATALGQAIKMGPEYCQVVANLDQRIWNTDAVKKQIEKARKAVKK